MSIASGRTTSDKATTGDSWDIGLIFGSSVINAAGGALLATTAAVHLVTDQGSIFWSCASYAAPWILPVLLYSLIATMTKGAGLRRWMLLGPVTAAATSLVAGVGLENGSVAVFITAMTLLGFCQALAKVGRTVLVKRLFAQHRHFKTITYVYNSFSYLGGGVGAVIGMNLRHQLDMAAVGGITAATGVITTITLATVFCRNRSLELTSTSKKKATAQEESLRHLMLSGSAAGRFAAAIILSVGFLQALFSSGKTVFPTVAWGDPNMVFWLHSASSIVIGAGSLLTPLIAAHLGKSSTIPLWLCVVVGPIAAGALLSLPVGPICFLMFAFGFEVIFTLAQGGLIQTLSPEQLATQQMKIIAFSTTISVACTLGLGFLAERGYLTVAVLGSVMALATLATAAARQRIAE